MTVRVVIADDQHLVRTGLCAIVNSEPGMTVVGQATDGAEAVEIVRRLHPDVVLMDVRMPRLDGVAATRALLAGPARHATEPKIAILTTYDVDAYVIEALRAGASGYLLKDATADQLTGAIRALAADGAILAPSVTRRLLDRLAPAPPAPGGRGGQALRDILSPREFDVMVLVADGLTNRQIASALNLAETTVKTHVQNMLAKLGLRSRVQLVIAAYDTGLARPSGHLPGQDQGDQRGLPMKGRARPGGSPSPAAGLGNRRATSRGGRPCDQHDDSVHHRPTGSPLLIPGEHREPSQTA